MSKEYMLAVPVDVISPTSRGSKIEDVLAELKRVGADRVWMCGINRGTAAEEVKQADIEMIRRGLEVFGKAGFEVGVWICSLGHGGLLTPDDVQDRSDRYVLMRGVQSKDAIPGNYCPSSEPFVTDFSDWIARIASTGVRMIMLDDDYRLSTRSFGAGCCCDMHMEEYRRRLGGEKVERSDLEALIYKGGPNRYRDAWLDMGHDMLVGLAKKIREKVDQVDRTVRVGFCAVMGTWGSDGADAIEITKALAGTTRPFLRTIGAPYWAWSSPAEKRVQYVVNSTLIQRYWCRTEDIEVFSEGDVYPRPRQVVPANYLEMYDMMLRASGGMDGILKYMSDYTADYGYETGYFDHMAHHRPAYDWIETHFSGRTAGVDAVAFHDTIRGSDLGKDGNCWAPIDDQFHLSFMTPLADTSLPMTVGGGSVHAVLGENGKYVSPELAKDGMLLDIVAALHLAARGVDVGIESDGETVDLPDGLEFFKDYPGAVPRGAAREIHKVRLKPGAVVLSRADAKDGIPTSYRYENASGERFYVLTFRSGHLSGGRGINRTYYRQRQMTETLEWAGRQKLPAVCFGWPDLYLVCRKDGDRMTVGLFNVSPDEVIEPFVKLDGDYKILSTFGAQASEEADGVKLKSTVPPFGFAGLHLQKAD